MKQIRQHAFDMNCAGHVQQGMRQMPIVDGPELVGDELVALVPHADVGRCILARTVRLECFADFVDLMVPRRQAREASKQAHREGPLREKLFGAGRRGLPATHPAAAVGS